MDFKRTFRHLFTPGWIPHRVFAPADRQVLTQAVRESERLHRGELRLVVEGPLPIRSLLAGHTARQRAERLFVTMGVGNTRERSGVLIYIQLVDRQVEVLADQGIAAKVDPSEWAAICSEMEKAFATSAFRRGALEAIDRATRLLALHFPARTENPNELPDSPLLL